MVNFLTLPEALEKHRERGVDFFGKSNAQQLKEFKNKVRDGLAGLLQTTPFEHERAAWGKAVYDLTEQFMRVGVMSKYDRLSYEIYRMGGMTLSSWKGSGYGVDRSYTLEKSLVLPLFLSVPTTDDEWSRTFETKGTYVDSYRGQSTDVVKITATAKAPKLIDKARVAIRDAEAFMYELFAGISRDEVVGTLIDRVRHGSATDVGAFVKLETNDGIFQLPTFSTLWRPSEKDWEIKGEVVPPPHPDPAVIMHYGSDQFVVDTWDIPNEQPFRHILKEFGISDPS